jgi:glutamate N-acetyltransferase / amino-acid N-acetyltransferase
MPDTPISPVKGIRLAAAAAGIRYPDRQDLVLMEIAAGASCAAVFTSNAFCAAPVVVAREHLEAATPRYLLINSGNANAGTGKAGLRAARQSCRLLAELAGCSERQVLPFSTGVIGEDLPLQPFASAMPQLLDDLRAEGWEQAAHAIMTTDTVPKMASRELEVDGSRVTLSGICKGSGMIRPDMATMLAFIATDAEVPAEMLQSGLQRAVAASFNSITVDGDTSTNDACVLVATGAGGAQISAANSGPFFAALDALCMELARAIVKDGEGATKLVEIRVESASSRREARNVAYAIAHSPLVKTALFASDPNWGRILAAVGRAGIDALDIERVRIWLDDLCIVSSGGRDPGYSEAAGQRVMQRPELTIRVDLGRGSDNATVLTCDLSHDYVRINAEYRT